MNLLKEGIMQQAVIKTAQTRKLEVDGLNKAYPVYKVRLDWLFYNDQNDRIATWISQYKAQHDGKAPDGSDRENYNKIIEQFIVESNPDAIRKTQKNIEMVDQREAGVVLVDGRIIDGNRRFTCLRRLANKNDRFNYFETVILDRNIENSAKQIKMMELTIQHGEESKVDYNPIDRLVGVYNDVISTQLLSVEEYSRSTNESETEVKKRIEVAKLMVEFLEFINAPEEFYIARDLQIYYPLEELLKLIKKCRTGDEVEDLKIAVFTNILMQTAGDMTRFVRHIKTIVGTEYQEEFFEEQKEIAAKVLDTLPERGKVTTGVIREVVRAKNETVQELGHSMEKVLEKARKTETKNRPIQLVKKAADLLDDANTDVIQKMNSSELNRLNDQMEKLMQMILSIQDKLDHAIAEQQENL